MRSTCVKVPCPSIGRCVGKPVVGDDPAGGSDAVEDVETVMATWNGVGVGGGVGS
jgi:hypothetical protein